MANDTKIKALLTDTDLRAIADLMGGLMDKQAAVLAGKKDLQEVKNDLQEVKDTMTTKADLTDAEQRIKSELKEYTHEGFEAVMEGIDTITQKLADKEKVERIEAWIKEAWFKLGVKYHV